MNCFSYNCVVPKLIFFFSSNNFGPYLGDGQSTAQIVQSAIVEKHGSPFTPENTSTPQSRRPKVIESSSFGFVQENESKLFEYSLNTDYSSEDNPTISEYVIICFIKMYLLFI